MYTGSQVMVLQTGSVEILIFCTLTYEPYHFLARAFEFAKPKENMEDFEAAYADELEMLEGGGGGKDTPSPHCRW